MAIHLRVPGVDFRNNSSKRKAIESKNFAVTWLIRPPRGFTNHRLSMMSQLCVTKPDASHYCSFSLRFPFKMPSNYLVLMLPKSKTIWQSKDTLNLFVGRLFEAITFTLSPDPCFGIGDKTDCLGRNKGINLKLTRVPFFFHFFHVIPCPSGLRAD